MSRDQIMCWVLSAALVLLSVVNGITHRRDQATIRQATVLLREGLVIVDSLEARNRCLEASGVDCTEPMTVGGDKLPYGRRP